MRILGVTVALFRDTQEVVITALGSLALFCIALAFLKTWMRGGS